jgi:hypothetical protein
MPEGIDLASVQDRETGMVAAPRLRTALLLQRLLLPVTRHLRLILRGAAGGELPRARALLLRRRLRRGLSRDRRRLAIGRLRRFPGFSSTDYLALNPDLRCLVRNPAAHALFEGSCAGRPLFRRQTLARTLGERLVQPVDPDTATVPPEAPAALIARTPRIGIHVSSHGNVFMHDIASDLVSTLTAAGVAAELRDETASIATRPPLNIFVAPHEFFVLGRGREWVREDIIAPAVMLNTEQVQTRWFAQALPFLLSARGVIDLNAQTRDLLAETGLPSLHLAPTPAPHRLNPADRAHPLFRVLPAAARVDPDPAAPFTARPLDIAFFGVASPRREAFFARNAGFFARFETFLYCRPARGPIRAATQEGALSRLARHVGGHARIVLNLHHDEFGYFEWHRIVRLGIAAGGVVVSEPCLPFPGIRPGEHYFEETLRQMPNLIEWLLLSDDGRRAARRVQENARRLLADTLGAEYTAARLLSFLLDGVVG